MRKAFRVRRDGFLGKIGRRPVVMGVLNVTPDSFFDGGRWTKRAAAFVHAKKLAAEGCDILDIGGESTRPGAVAVSAADELARIEPIVAELAENLDVPLSIDTSKADIAARALALGAIAVNDVWGLQKD